MGRNQPLTRTVYNYDIYRDKYKVKNGGRFGLSNVAATIVNLLGYEAPGIWDESMIQL